MVGNTVPGDHLRDPAHGRVLRQMALSGTLICSHVAALNPL